MHRIPIFAAAISLLAISSTPSPPVRASESETTTIDRLISHTSTVPAIKGKKVELFVRERIPSSYLSSTPRSFEGKVVLFVHGGYSPSTLAFDVPYRNYSWMEALAHAGYDAFAMDMTGYGRSSRPLMDDPCNLDPKQQPLLVPRNLKAPCPNAYPFQLVNSDSETDDINAVVDYIRKLRGVSRVTLIGWSGGGIRSGTYASRHPDKVDKLIVWSSSNYSRKNPDDPPATIPASGSPMTMQIREIGIDRRWLGNVKCEGQVEPGMPDLIAALNSEHDKLASQWGPGGLRAPTRTYWGWNAKSAGRIKVPTLIIAGEQDRLHKSNAELFDDLGAAKKVFISVACATHFMNWERQRRILHRASLQWLADTAIEGESSGRFKADPEGHIAKAPQ